MMHIYQMSIYLKAAFIPLDEHTLPQLTSCKTSEVLLEIHQRTNVYMWFSAARCTGAACTLFFNRHGDPPRQTKCSPFVSRTVTSCGTAEKGVAVRTPSNLPPRRRALSGVNWDLCSTQYVNIIISCLPSFYYICL